MRVKGAENVYRAYLSKAVDSITAALFPPFKGAKKMHINSTSSTDAGT